MNEKENFTAAILALGAQIAKLSEELDYHKTMHNFYKSECEKIKKAVEGTAEQASEAVKELEANDFTLAFGE